MPMPSSVIVRLSLLAVACGVFAIIARLLRARRESVEIVVAHYDEDLSWLDQHRGSGVKVSVYSKGLVAPEAGAHMLSNVGRESHAYLHHIVTNWKSLADWTIFTRGSR